MYSQMHENTFLTTPNVQKYHFLKKSFWWSRCIRMHQNTSLSTPDGKKYLFWKKVSGGLEVCANASKHVFKHSRHSKIPFLKKSFWCFWWSGSMLKCIKTRFKPLQTFKNIFFEKKFLVFLVVWKYAKMHQNTFLTTPEVKKKNIFFKEMILVVWKYVNTENYRLQTKGFRLQTYRL